MRIAQINLPILDNDGNDLADAHEKLQRDLCEAFGGFTVTEGRGAWVDNGKLYQETVMVYQIAYEPNSTAPSQLRAEARHIGALAKQIAMFLVLDGEAEIITI